MRVKCANCGMIYEISPTSMDFRTQHEIESTATCPRCKSNAKDRTVKGYIVAYQGKNIHAVELGRLGGLKGGPARAENLTKEELSEIARKAANARWSKEKLKLFS